MRCGTCIHSLGFHAFRLEAGAGATKTAETRTGSFCFEGVWASAHTLEATRAARSLSFAFWSSKSSSRTVRYSEIWNQNVPTTSFKRTRALLRSFGSSSLNKLRRGRAEDTVAAIFSALAMVLAFLFKTKIPELFATHSRAIKLACINPSTIILHLPSIFILNRSISRGNQ